MAIRQSVSRRRFLVTAATGVGTGLAANPLGLFSSARAASAGIPSGEYLRPLTDDRFWFHLLRYQDHLENPKLGIDPPASQLSMRLGLAGGFAVGYFNTLSFLGEYKEKKPADYRDLLVGTAGLPVSLPAKLRRDRTATMLEQHRKHAGLPSRRVVIPDKSEWKAERSKEADSSKTEQALIRPLERLSTDELSKSVEKAIRSEKHTGEKVTNLKDAPLWDDANKAAQTTLDNDFKGIHPYLETRIDALDTGRVVKFVGGKLDLSWLNNTLFPTAFEDGIRSGRLAALAYMAMVEAGIILKSTVPPKEGTVADIDRSVVKFREARLLENAFGGDDFWRHGLDVAAFRPAVRLTAVCIVKDDKGASRHLRINTPFLPFDVTRRLDAHEKALQEKTDDRIATAVTKYFSDTALSRYEMPVTTQTVLAGAFDGCGEVFRHTARMLRVASDTFPPLAASKLQHVTLVPEVTSPWTFAGVGAALFNAYLTGLTKAEKLATEEERYKWKVSIAKSVDELLQRSVRNDDKLANSSAAVPAMVQYASGYRAALRLADGLADKVAEAKGAQKVYENLMKAMPEYFKALPMGVFLSADDIAGHVLQIATGVQTEINQLRLRVRELEAALKQYQKFNEDLADLIRKLQGQLGQVKNQADLREFQKYADSLLAQMRTNLDTSQSATLSSLQGLVNTFLQVGVNIEANIEATIKAQAKTNIQFCSVGGAK